MKTFTLKTLGCKVNAFDSHALQHQMLTHGFVASEHPRLADIMIINSCSVTENAEKEARYLVRRYRRDNPNTFIVMTGCYAQTNSQKLAEMGGIDFIVPNEVKADFVTLLQNRVAEGGNDGNSGLLPPDVKAVKDNRGGHFKSSVTLFDQTDADKTRATIKIQDGCDGFCTYCLIPYARGSSRSVASEKVLQEIIRLAKNGMNEVVLTGIHIGDYGKDLTEPTSLAKLLRSIIATTRLRIRISSLEPGEVSEELLAVFKDHTDRICPHFHLPLQSGSDRVLKLMKRSYNSQEYGEVVFKLRQVFPEANIGADIIPGFPSETQGDHDETLTFIEKTGLNYLHVFPYSKRPATAAARMPGHLEPNIIKARASELRSLSLKILFAYQRQFCGKELNVLWESEQDEDGRRIGKSENYLNIVCRDPIDLAAGSLSKIKVMGFKNQSILMGSINPS